MVVVEDDRQAACLVQKPLRADSLSVDVVDDGPAALGVIQPSHDE